MTLRSNGYILPAPTHAHPCPCPPHLIQSFAHPQRSLSRTHHNITPNSPTTSPPFSHSFSKTMESPQLVQHVTKASSDQLLRKFAEIDSDSDYDNPPSSPRKSSSKRHGRRTTQKKRKVVKSKCDVYGDENDWETCMMMSPSKEVNVGSNASLRVVERKSLLPQHYKTRRSSSSSSGNFIVKHLRSHHFRGARDFRTKCVLSAIEKTWSRAVRGASKVFMEKHYNRHRSLIDDIV